MRPTPGTSTVMSTGTAIIIDGESIRPVRGNAGIAFYKEAFELVR
jgi:hypothetical protein